MSRFSKSSFVQKTFMSSLLKSIMLSKEFFKYIHVAHWKPPWKSLHAAVMAHSIIRTLCVFGCLELGKRLKKKFLKNTQKLQAGCKTPGFADSKNSLHEQEGRACLLAHTRITSLMTSAASWKTRLSERTKRTIRTLSFSGSIWVASAYKQATVLKIAGVRP